MSRNSKNAKRIAGVGGYGQTGAKSTQPKHGKQTRSEYNTAGRTGFSLSKKKERA